jgi:hypothetical protein
MYATNIVATLTLGLQQSVKCKGLWGWKCVYVWNTFSQMEENAKDETQWFPSAPPLWKLHLCECCKPLKP